ncbi:uncharacterized protein LOC105696092 [Orussus abietinus]|uniref:uncharacterized protein LOC105696092 n=1 Tax=Orussus abietinus TaxID=222816 RepID=UPI0006253AD7|nr:uncharacterized protein LOC105696092 [Orussus abietinus]
MYETDYPEFWRSQHIIMKSSVIAMKFAGLMLGVISAIAIGCHGFEIEVPEASVPMMAVPIAAPVPAQAAGAWDIAPPPNAGQSVFFDHILNGKMQVTGMDKVLQASDTKKSAKHVDQAVPEEPQREKRSDAMVLRLINVNRALKFPRDIRELAPLEELQAGPSKGINTTPKNVVLIFVNETEQDHQSFWSDFRAKHSFPVQSLLQSCQSSELSPVKLSPDEIIFGRDKKDCACDHFLKTNVSGLLSWAHHVKNMKTGTVSATNFSDPSALGYEGSITAIKKIDETSVKSEVETSKSELLESWHMVDLNKQQTDLPLSPSETTPPNIQQFGGTNDGMWDVFDMFSKIRSAFFRTLLDSLGGNLGGPEDEFSPRRPFPLQPSLIDLVGDTVKELKAVSGDEGYMLVAVTQAYQLSPVVDLIQREDLENTLLVVSGICSYQKKPVPFFASGPGSKALFEIRTMWDLVGAIKNSITGGCPGLGCKNRRHDIMSLPSGILMSLIDDNSPSKKRIIRKDDNGDSEESGGNGNTTSESPKNTGGANGILPMDSITLLFGAVTSVVTSLILKP